MSVYNYASNDPIENIDLHGLQGVSNYIVDHITNRIENVFQEWVDEVESAWVATVETVEQVGSNIQEGIDELGEYLGDQEGTSMAEDYHDSGDKVKGDGVTVLSNSELNSNGTAETPVAREGSTVILEQDGIQTPGTGVSADFAKDKVGQPLNAINRATDAINQIREINGEEPSAAGERFDTTRRIPFGGDTIYWVRPIENDNE